MLIAGRDGVHPNHNWQIDIADSEETNWEKWFPPVKKVSLPHHQSHDYWDCRPMLVANSPLVPLKLLRVHHQTRPQCSQIRLYGSGQPQHLTSGNQKQFSRLWHSPRIGHHWILTQIIKKQIPQTVLHLGHLLLPFHKTTPPIPPNQIQPRTTHHILLILLQSWHRVSLVLPTNSMWLPHPRYPQVLHLTWLAHNSPPLRVGIPLFQSQKIKQINPHQTYG